MKTNFGTLQFCEKTIIDCISAVKGHLRFSLALRKNATLVAAALKETREMINEDPLMKAHGEAMKALGQEFGQKMKKELDDLGSSKGDDVAALERQRQDIVQGVENEHREALKKLNSEHPEAMERNAEILNMELDFAPWRISFDDVPDLPDELLEAIPIFGVLNTLEIVDFGEGK